MQLSDDPDLGDLRREFLQEVSAIHEAHGFTDDWDAFAAALGVTVREGARSHYVSKSGSAYIFLASSEWGVRRNYSFAHEIAHHLFGSTDNDFRTVLHETFLGASAETLRDHEEAFCHEAAALLIFPKPLLMHSIRTLGLTPQAVMHLAAARGASHSAALIRVVSSFHFNLWGYVVNRQHTTEFSWTNTRYRAGKGTLIEKHHPMRAAWHEPLEARAELPFKVSRKRWPMTMRAAGGGNQVVALFAGHFPPTPNDEQPALFPSIAWDPSSAMN